MKATVFVSGCMTQYVYIFLTDNEGINSGNYQSMLTGYWVHWVYWFYHVADISDLLARKENPLCV